MSPSSDTTTPVTATIIPKMLEDIVKVIVDN
jgi:tubulin monoglycylase TTLL3/8